MIKNVVVNSDKGVFSIIFNIFKPKPKCDMCKRKTRAFQMYLMPNGEKKKYCLACSEYAERRAYKRI